jgi:branched-chain amino acid transport system permease protein
MEMLTLVLINVLSYGLLLFLLSSGLTLIFGMMGVLNFAHGAFYMLGAYLAYSLSGWLGFWVALLLAPLLVGALGALFEFWGLRRVRRHGHVPELLMTFGLGFVAVEVVHAVWGRSAVDYRVPELLDGPLLVVHGVQLSTYRVFVMGVALAVLGGLWLLLRSRTGLVIRAALTQPQMLEALGHNVPRVFTAVFSAGCALAGLAGVLGGAAFVTEPAMAHSIGALVFVVVVVGGLGSLPGALLASLLIGLLQTLVVTWSVSSRWAGVLPFVLMVLTLIWRADGLMGRRQADG